MSNPRRSLVQGLLISLAAALPAPAAASPPAKAPAATHSVAVAAAERQAARAVVAGSAAVVNGTVRTRRGHLRVRAAATARSRTTGTLHNGATVALVCAVTGQRIRGPLGASAQWDRLPSGHYVSHAYITGAMVPRCAGVPGSAPAQPPAPPAGSAQSGSTPAPTSQLTRAQFIATVAGPAQAAFRSYGIPASVTIAQAILESGWGRGNLATQYRNYFGIQCGKNSARGPIAIGCRPNPTVECSGGSCGRTTATFRVYATAANSFQDHSLLLSTSRRYRSAFAHSGNADQFVVEVWKGGYATDPNYPQIVINIMRKYNLYRYDRL